MKSSDIKHLNDYALGFFILSGLRRLYSASGHSRGRSIRSHLLEEAQLFMSWPEDAEEAYLDGQNSLNKLLDEAKKRIKEGIPSQGILFSELKYIPDAYFSRMILEKLKQEYEKPNKKYYPVGEYELINTAFAMLPLPYNSPKYRYQVLREEASVRFTSRFKRSRQ